MEKQISDMTNEEIVAGIRAKIVEKNQHIDELEDTVQQLQDALSKARKEIESSDKLFEMLSEVLKREDLLLT